jgi:2-dehydro-3-deoxyphosphogluconate aldolase/(4S)-4-hydroxy-2-oxoglutarate aldolase
MDDAQPSASATVAGAQSFEGRLEAAGVVPVLTVPEGADAGALARVLADNGLPVIEATLRTAAGLAAISAMRAAAPAAFVGAGTVLTADSARAAIDAGAQFVVSPGFHAEVVEVAQSLGVPALPGVMTPTDIGLCLARGITLVKLFPASQVGGIPWIKALAAPYRAVRFVPTGGLKADDIPAYLAEPAVVAIGGSWIAPPELILGDLSAVGARAREAAAAVAEARGTR